MTGIVSATLGTSGVVFAHSDQPTRDPQGRVHTMCHAVPGKWCVFGCMLAAGGSFQWFRNNLGDGDVARARVEKVDPYELLTEREREVLQLAAEGNSNKAIAGRLNLSTLTVETHRKRISEKLNLHGPADLILYAVRAGIIPTAPLL